MEDKCFVLIYGDPDEGVDRRGFCRHTSITEMNFDTFVSLYAQTKKKSYAESYIELSSLGFDVNKKENDPSASVTLEGPYKKITLINSCVEDEFIYDMAGLEEDN
jgi:hypothetical protein